MLESKLNLNFDLVEQARNHASKVADDTQRFIDRHTTVAVEPINLPFQNIEFYYLTLEQKNDKEAFHEF